MAEDKKGVVVYTDWMEKFEALEDDEAGRLVKHFFRYINDLNPTAPDRITKISFIDIENTLKRDLKKWEKTIEGRSKAGKASAEARKSSKQNSTNSTNVENVENIEQNPTNSTVIDTVIVSDTVRENDTVTENDILLEKETKEYNPNGFVDLKNQPISTKINFDELLSFFNTNRGLMPEVKKLSDTRKKRIQTLEKQYGKKSIQLVIEKVRDSSFLQGDNKDNWTATFDWIFKPANFLKILEDNYVNKEIFRIDSQHKQSAVKAVNALFGRGEPRTNREIFEQSIASETARGFNYDNINRKPKFNINQ